MPDHVVVRTEDLVALHPRLFHMTAAGAWPAIERHGLRSVTALLDLLYFDPQERPKIEAVRRPETIVLSDRAIGTFEIRDQKPLSLAKLKACLVDMTPEEWLRLLNRKVFFWPTEERVRELLGALAYRSREHLVLVIDTASLLAIHGPEVTLAPINTGAVLYNPPPRGRDTLLPIADYPFERWRQRRGSARKAIAEVAVEYAVPDILNHIVRIERRRHGARLDAAPNSDRVKPVHTTPVGASDLASTSRRGRMDFDRAARFIAAVPRGRWTAYKDVATAAGNENGAQPVGTWCLRNGAHIPNVHRVIQSSGYIAEEFMPAGTGIPTDAAGVRARLRAEGVRIDSTGKASPAQRFTVEDWDERDEGD
jgi:alkylated DNA nucleotide flippase Atl1